MDKLYKLAAGKTAKSILVSCGARLAPFDIQEVRDITAYDELRLDELGDRKTALFLIMSDKYDLTKHPNYHLTADYDERNAFDVETLVNRKLRLKKEERYLIIDGDQL